MCYLPVRHGWSVDYTGHSLVVHDIMPSSLSQVYNKCDVSLIFEVLLYVGTMGVCLLKYDVHLV